MEDASEVLPAEFHELSCEILELQRKKKKIDEQIEAKRVLGLALMADVKDDESWSARGDGWSVSFIKPAPRETLVRELLIQQGVTMKQIEKATKKTESKPYVTFRESED